jgi:hypothetical protein
MATPEREQHADSAASVSEYKSILAAVLDRRPSGTRQRLAAALAKNRSFISQISNPAYSTPIPANHVDVIFETCHFSADERKAFMSAYGRAHPKRFAVISESQRLKAHTVYLPDLGDDLRNERLHTIVSDFVRQIARLIEEEPGKDKGP